MVNDIFTQNDKVLLLSEVNTLPNASEIVNIYNNIHTYFFLELHHDKSDLEESLNLVLPNADIHLAQHKTTAIEPGAIYHSISLYNLYYSPVFTRSRIYARGMYNELAWNIVKLFRQDKNIKFVMKFNNDVFHCIAALPRAIRRCIYLIPE